MNDGDYIRAELEMALQLRKAVIPLLIDGAAMPAENELPSSLAAFPYLNGASIHSGRDFHSHMNRVISRIDQLSFVDAPVQSEISNERQTATAMPTDVDNIYSPMDAAAAYLAILPTTGNPLEVGDFVFAGDQVAALEVMMQTISVKAHKEGFVQEILFKEGDAVDKGACLIILTQVDDRQFGPAILRSPTMGTIHLCDLSSGGTPYVHVGSTVTTGQTLLSIEHMNPEYADFVNAGVPGGGLFVREPVLSPRDGRVARIFVGDDQFVGVGTPLLTIV